MKFKCRYSTFIIMFYFINMIVLSNGSIAAKIGKLLFAGMSVVYLIGVKKKKSFKWIKLELWMIGYAIYACLSYFWAYSRIYAISGIKTILLNTFCIYLLVQVLLANKDWKNIVLKTIAVCPLFLFLRLLFKYGIDVFGGIRSLGVGEHNSTGMYAAIGCVFCIYYIISSGNKFLFWRLIAVINFFIVLLSMSRKAMVYLMIPIIICYLLTGENISQKIRGFIIIIVLIVCTWIAVINIPVLYRYIGSGLESALNYFNEGVGDASAAGRNTRIVFGIARFKQRPWFGWGAMNYNKLFGEFQVGMDMVIADNNFIDILVNFGIIGFVVYYSIYIKGIAIFVTTYHKNALEKVAPFALLITLLVCDYGVSAYLYLYSQTFIMLCIGMMLDNKNEDYILRQERV